ncbi:MAG: hypothetical protein M1817_004289 [Caeruleum heppii]|nr:MAG: hypothetical protein M1817_004289 [Caeruleum heppii]
MELYRQPPRETEQGQFNVPKDLPRRPATGITVGKACTVKINSYDILQYPTQTVYQYDIQIGNGIEKRGLVKKVWGSQAVKKATGPSWIFDGNKIAWSLNNIQKTTTFWVDLDAEAGIPPNDEHENKHMVVIRKTTPIELSSLQSYLQGKSKFSNSVLQAINFLDHLLREMPSKNLVALKQSFYGRPKDRSVVGGGVEAYKGVYQSIRACQGGRLGINVDVANGTFWCQHTIMHTAMALTGTNSLGMLVARCERVRSFHDRDKMVQSEQFKELRRLHKMAFNVRHRGNTQAQEMWFVHKILEENAREYKFSMKNKETGESTMISIFDYFKKRYNVWLEWPQLPLIQTTKKNVIFPMELAHIAPHQRYPYKLNPDQTAKMIRFAVTRPHQRAKDIEEGRQWLEWEKDIFLQNYGMKISPKMIETKARVLDPPTVQFKNSTVKPGLSGRWDLKGPRKFLTVNTDPLAVWSVCIFQARNPKDTINKPTVENFIREFIKVYQGHGGIVVNKNPPIIQAQDAAKGVEVAWHMASKDQTIRPQMLVFILADANAFHYTRVKKSADCRFGVMSQCMQAAQVAKMHSQYMSNVCMKFNAKLGGSTSRILTKNPILGHFKVPSLIIGADVSHASPGAPQASMAAMTVSMDKWAVRYAAACQTNGHRVEMISTINITNMIIPLVGWWIMNVNARDPPQHIYYFRDGVSEGQYQHVLQNEIQDIKDAFKVKMPEWQPKFIAVVVSKRHHIRFFPTFGDKVVSDRNGNPNPGTIVERDVTHPTERDVYMVSHSAIQGTARPVHYHVLLDEAGLSENELYTMIYEHCYQYIRSTTPVSLHPSVYYAHLASNRARSHEDIAASSGPQSGPGAPGVPGQMPVTKKEKARAAERAASQTTPEKLVEAKPLLKMPDAANIDRGMWYI